MSFLDTPVIVGVCLVITLMLVFVITLLGGGNSKADK